LYNKSRMRREFQVRFCERLGLKCPCLLYFDFCIFVKTKKSFKLNFLSTYKNSSLSKPCKKKNCVQRFSALRRCGLEVQMFILVIKFIRIPMLKFSTYATLAQNRCWAKLFLCLYNYFSCYQCY
jgi:hypothetical protein